MRSSRPSLDLSRLRALIFDMDGVLVDPSESYRAVIVECVRRAAVDFGLSEPAVDRTWASELKRCGGFNNDWDLTAGLVRGLVARTGFDVVAYSNELAALGGGLTAVDQLLGAAPPNLDARGPLQDMFQQIYLGESLYERIYGRPRTLVTGPGYIERETAMVSAQELASVALPKAIATGRPRAEAGYALNAFDFEQEFGPVVTHDDVVDAGERGKPDPWCVYEAARQLGVSADGQVAYIGDTADDMRAARAASMMALGIGDETELCSAGADVVFSTTRELLAALISAA
ncbi:MAG: HAD superfamily phosphatase [Myxococcota bacterium]